MWHRDHDSDEPIVVIEKNETSLGSLLLGMAIGASLALLFAPRAGVETRRELSRSARRVKLIAKDAAEDVADEVVDRYQHARQKVEETIDTTRRAIDLKKRQASQAIRAGREAAQDARDDLERRIAETKAAYQAGGDVARMSRTRGRVTPDQADDDDSSGGV
ncbi:MAG: YtxH domain-containing protein [Gemmatimonadaceae bacterium]